MSLTAILDDGERRHAQSVASSDHPARAGVVRSLSELEELAKRWPALEARSRGATLFQSLGWVRAVYAFEAARGNTAFDPVIATLEYGQRLVAVMPLERIATASRKVLVPLGNSFGQYADILLEPGSDPAHAVEALLRAALDAAPADVVSFLKVRDGSPLALGLPKTRIETGTMQGAPFVDFTAYPDFATYFATIRNKTRKNMRNGRNRLEREGPVEHRIVVRPSERLKLIERTLAGRAERLKDQGLTSRAFSDSGFFDFCRSLVTRPDLDVAAYSLLHNGKPIAEQWGFVHGGRYYAYVATRDFSNSDESPGKLQLSAILQSSAERGLMGCDLGVPAMPYKLTFATETVPVRDYALPVTPRGWIIVQAWDVMLRPLLKSTALRLPASMRTRIMRLLRRDR